ncbi:MAG: hypothetical protein JKY09_05070, partial [Crocinitomicaceae bacterium]|nr:hypothetical protein [Crocinitomicaceae bacterium]
MKKPILFALSLFTLFLSYNSSAADYYWIGGTGNWSDLSHWSTTSGGATDMVITPGTTDNVIFDNNSGLASINDTVFMDVPVTVNDFNYSAVSNVFTISSVLASIEIQGSLSANGLVNFNWFGNVNMNASVAVNLTSNGTNWNHDFHLIGTGTVTMLDDFINTSDIYVDQGGLVSNNNTITCFDFYSNTASTRSIDFNNSAINLVGTNWLLTTPSLTWTSSPSTINITNTGIVIFDGGSQIYDTIRVLSSDFQISGDNTFSLVNLDAISQLTLDNGSTQLLDSLVTTGSCGSPTIIQSSNPALASASIQKSGFPTFSGSNLSINNVDALSPGTETYNIQLSDTTNGADGWTLGIAYYWVTGTGNWSDANHWSATSGGGSVGTLPTSLDNVIFDDNSGLASIADIVTMDIPVTVNDFDLSAVSTVFTINSVLASIEIQGSLAANGLVNFGWNGDINMNPCASQNLISNGTNWAHDFHFIGAGTVTMQDDFTNTSDIYVDQGNLISNNTTITCFDFYSNTASTRSINFDNSAINLVGTNWLFTTPSLTWTSSPSTININNIGTVIFDGGNQIYDTVRVLSSDLQISDDNTFSLVHLDTASQLTLDNGSTQIMDSLVTYGSCTSPTIIESANNLLASASIQKSGFSNFYGRNLSINNVDALNPGSQTYSLYRSDTTNGAGGWTFLGSRYYWIGDAGNWSDTLHWSFSSGGVTSGCLPNKLDSVLFDGLSFSTLGQEVLVDTVAKFSYMDWSASLNDPTLRLDSSMFSYGDILFQPNLFVTRSNQEPRIEFLQQANFYPDSSMINCNVSVFMDNSSDSLLLTSYLRMSDSTSISLLSGEIYTQNNGINTGSIQVLKLPSLENKLLDLGSSQIKLNIGFNSDSLTTSFTFNSGTSNIFIGDTNNYYNYLITEDLTFYDVTLDFSDLDT